MRIEPRARGRTETSLLRENDMFVRLRLALAAGVLALTAPTANAATPPDTLVLAQNIDEMLTRDPAEAYEFTGVEIVSNVYGRIMRAG
jgi:peptide/nickel transport system substrate-binding protein